MNIQQFYPLFLQSTNVSIDSRTVTEGTVFFAFSGDNYNAATKAEEAIGKGAIAVLVEDRKFEDNEKNIFYVNSTLQFLQELAKFHRQQISIPIIALTGSNGKTTTKELIAAVLSRKFNVQFTKGNLNNHIGVPLTLLSIKPEHEIAVVEMGANHQLEIAELCEIAEPDLGYITNFGKAHLEGFGGFEGVIKGKSEMYDYLLKHQKRVLVNDTDDIQKEKTDELHNKITFGTPASDYFFEMVSEDKFMGIRYGSETAMSHLTGAYNFTNLSAAAALGLHFNIPFPEIIQAVENYIPTNMRSQVVEREGKTWVLDTYNANPSSMSAALENFNSFPGTKTVILGDMLELGTASGTEHAAILNLAKNFGFEKILLVGKAFSALNEEKSFPTTKELSDYLTKEPISTKNVLLKGSRGIALEKILESI